MTVCHCAAAVTAAAAAAADAADQSQGGKLARAVEGQVCQARAAQGEAGRAERGRGMLPVPEQRQQGTGPRCGCSQRRSLQQRSDVGKGIRLQGAPHALPWWQRRGVHQVPCWTGGWRRGEFRRRRRPSELGSRQAASGIFGQRGMIANMLRPAFSEELHFGAKRQGAVGGPAN